MQRKAEGHRYVLGIRSELWRGQVYGMCMCRLQKRKRSNTCNAKVSDHTNARIHTVVVQKSKEEQCRNGREKAKQGYRVHDVRTESGLETCENAAVAR